MVMGACACAGQAASGLEPVTGPELVTRHETVRGMIARTQVAVIAHRGCWRHGPENSLTAIRACAAMGVDMVELDVRKTRDGVLVLMHDETLDRTTGLTGRLEDHTYADLQQTRLRQGAGGDASLTDETVPTLQQALEADHGRALINLDLKEDLYTEALDVIAAAGAQDRVLFKMRAAPDSDRLRAAPFLGRTAFMPIIVQCAEKDPGGAYCITDLAGEADAYDAYDPVAFEIVFREDDFIDESVPALAENGTEIWVNTLYPSISGGRADDDGLTDPDRVWGSLIDRGVSMIQTDRPQALIDYLEQRGLQTRGEH